MSEVPNNYLLPFPKRMRLLMDKEQVNQQELADFIGVKRQTIAQWKDGKTNPDIYNFAKIAEFFGVPHDYLLGNTDSLVIENMILEGSLGLSDSAITNIRYLAGNHPENRAEQDENVLCSEIVSEFLGDARFVSIIQNMQDGMLETKMWSLREYGFIKTEEEERKESDAINYLATLGVRVDTSSLASEYYWDKAKAEIDSIFSHIEAHLGADVVGTIHKFIKETYPEGHTVPIEEVKQQIAKHLRKFYGIGDSCYKKDIALGETL